MNLLGGQSLNKPVLSTLLLTGLPCSPGLWTRLLAPHPSVSHSVPHVLLFYPLSCFFRCPVPGPLPLEPAHHHVHDRRRQAPFCPLRTRLRMRSGPQAPPATRNESRGGTPGFRLTSSTLGLMRTLAETLSIGAGSTLCSSQSSGRKRG